MMRSFWFTIILLFTVNAPPSLAQFESWIREKDWEKSTYFCETTKNLTIERDRIRSRENFKFQMTVTRTGVTFSEETFGDLDQIHFGGMYNWWTGKNTRHETTVEFSPDARGYQQYNKGYFSYYSGANYSPGGPYLEVTAIFADCYEFK